MKYGVIYYKDTDNIGDDIQTYAAYRILPSVDYVIDREHLQEFIPDKKESVKAIANGWFNHDKQNFLFSPYINPLLISMHFSQNDLITDSGYSFLKGYAKEYLEKLGPVGCRDHNTEKVLKDFGYKTYFSSCLTLTLDTVGKKNQKDYICAVDLKPEVLEHLKSITNSEIKEVTHWLLFDNKTPYDKRLEIIEEYTNKSFDDRRKYVKKNASLSFDQRMKNVEKMLTIYQNAKLVITDRIHVALPCLALNTPVLFIYYDRNADRVATFRDFLVNCTEDEFLKFKSEDLQFQNKKVYLKYRKELIKKCKEFVEKKEDSNKLPELEDYKEFIKRINYEKEMYLSKIYKDKKTYKPIMDEHNKLVAQNEELVKENQALKERNAVLEEGFEEYNKIRNSRSWKLIGKYYNRKVHNQGDKNDRL